ncbi:hypothetical protein ACLMJK_004155 [Lecanora helva]
MSTDGRPSIVRNKEQSDEHLNDEDQGGLFGSGSEDENSIVESPSNKRRKLDDEELDSGDDEGRHDREGESLNGHEKEEVLETKANVMSANVGRHPDPKPSDGELYLLSFPNFIGTIAQNFTLKHFQPPTTDHHSDGLPSSAFSALHTSNNTIRWRHSPSDANKTQSNARILRWSDGSLTLQIASNPREQFELTAKPLTQPQVNPKKPTPTSKAQSRANDLETYNSRLDSHTYLGAPHEHAQLIRLTNHVTAALAVQSSSDQNDEALIRLKEQMAEAQKGSKKTADGGLAIITISEDPELAKKRAELAEKEKSKMQRRLQVQQDRETTRSNNVLKRSGLRAGGMGAGLTVGGLEDDDGMATTKGRVSKPSSRRTRRRNSEYSDDEEDYRGRGRTREDEYDEDDGFLVGSDEEPEVGEESEEEEEMEDDGDVEEVKRKPSRRDSEEVPGGRVKRRRIIEDEDED